MTVNISAVGNKRRRQHIDDNITNLAALIDTAVLKAIITVQKFRS